MTAKNVCGTSVFEPYIKLRLGQRKERQEQIYTNIDVATQKVERETEREERRRSKSIKRKVRTVLVVRTKVIPVVGNGGKH